MFDCRAFAMRAVALCAVLWSGAGCSPSTPAAPTTSPPVAYSYPLVLSENDRAAILWEVEMWLALMDRGEYENAWTQASAMFKRKSLEDSKRVWDAQRAPLGGAKARATQGCQAVRFRGRSLYGCTFATVFEGQTDVDESVMMTLEPDGQWRTEDYSLWVGHRFIF